ncbi:hypothetical protein JCM10213_005837 [Rhodosporidiobolus nylandii]
MPASNGFSMPKPTLASNFEWQPTFDELLEQTATTNVVDADWPILKDMIKHKLAEAISSFLAMGPPWPLAPEDALQARSRAYETLDGFGGPPFTIQRLCELALHPRSSYTSLPKYLRAVSRVLSVTSEKSAFADAEDDAGGVGGGAGEASTSAVTLDLEQQGSLHLGVVREGVVLSPAHHTHRRGGSRTPSASASPSISPRASPSPSASPRSSPSSSPSVVPLLTPIPWLQIRQEATTVFPSSSPPSSASTSDPAAAAAAAHALDPLPPGSSSPSASPRLSTSSLPLPLSLPVAGSLPSTSSASSTASGVDPQISPSPQHLRAETATPTGGLVDEVDPGSGTGEVVEPVSLTGEGGATTLSLSLGLEGLGEDGGTGAGDGLRERFVRASSPKVERPLDPEEREKEGMQVDGEGEGDGAS